MHCNAGLTDWLCWAPGVVDGGRGRECAVEEPVSAPGDVRGRRPESALHRRHQPHDRRDTHEPGIHQVPLANEQLPPPPHLLIYTLLTTLTLP